VVTIYTRTFNIQIFSIFYTECICVFSKQARFISIYIINLLIVVTETKCFTAQYELRLKFGLILFFIVFTVEYSFYKENNLLYYFGYT
jgi:hypothetical protein